MVVGLGNPGEGYEASRHNVGFLVVDALASRVGATFRRRYRSLFARAAFDGKDVLLVKPLTFMNDSGSSVLKWQHAGGLQPAQIIVVHDDLDLPLCRLRIKARGSHGGHGGVRSIQEALGGGSDLLRVKVGIGRPRPGRDAVAHVLGPFEKAERDEIDRAVEQAADAVEVVLLEGVQAAMNRYNVRASRRRGRENRQPEGGEARELI
jgi:PTH1 family peptidyl-tRNA hydrolase